VNTLYSRNKDLEDDEPAERDPEVTLGTSFIVGIFFALILICAIFFAFGYSLGRRSALPASGVPAPAASTDTGASAAKPASGIPEGQPASQTEENTSDEQISPAAAQETPVVLPAKLAVKPTPVNEPVATLPAAAATVQAVVQVAAVSRQGDAAMLMTALKRKGYNAAIRQVPQDKLLHVQIGPFTTKKDAEAMRQRLIGDGYNAIVK
jgi:DedD protein